MTSREWAVELILAADIVRMLAWVGVEPGEVLLARVSECRYYYDQSRKPEGMWRPLL